MKKVLENDRGYYIYRKPNIAEKMIILGEMGYSEKELKKLEDNEDSPEMLIFGGKILQKFGDYVTEVNIKHNDETVTSYNRLLELDICTGDLVESAMKMLESGVSQEKKQELSS